MNPKYPLYIVSKGRADSRLTSRALEGMNVPYYIIIEKQEYNEYAAVIDKRKILVLPKEKYHKEYKVLDSLGLTKSPGPGPARNFAWDHSISNGFKWHWVMDDNIRQFSRFNNNMIIKVNNGTIFRCMEDFCNRYTNLVMAGPNYEMFVPRKVVQPPVVYNSRIYSCNLIRNDIPHRWRGRYNEDTIISLDILSSGLCTAQFNAFLQLKTTTQAIKGGNTAEFYAKEGTYPKSKMLVDAYPNISRIKWRFNRCHHYVDYSSFRDNKLKRRLNLDLGSKVNNYGMELKCIKK